MIYGIGTDIADCARVAGIYEKHGYHFVKNILTKKELELLDAQTGKAEFIAGRWAAKEAFSKALKTGMCADCAFVEIEILPGPRNVPEVTLHAATAETVRRLGITRIHVSISHERAYAVGMAVLECADPK